VCVQEFSNFCWAFSQSTYKGVDWACLAEETLNRYHTFNSQVR